MLIRSSYLIEGTANITIPPTGVLHFLELGPYNFTPSAARLSTQESTAEWREAGAPGSGIAVSEQQLDALYPIKVRTWTISRKLLATLDGTAQLHIVKNWTDQNVHPFWLQVILLNDTSVLSLATQLRRKHVGAQLGGLSAGLRNLSFTSEAVQAQRESLVDPILSGLPADVELTDRDPLIERAAFPKTAMKIAFGGPHSTVSPMFAYNSGLLFTMNNADAFHESSAGHIDTWAYPGLLVGDSVLSPAPVSAQTSWELSATSGRSLPIFRIQWATDDISVTQRLSSQLVNGIPMGVAHFKLTAITAAARGARFIVAVGRKPGVRDLNKDLTEHWAHMRSFNRYNLTVDASGSSMLTNGASPASALANLTQGTVAMLSTAELSLHSVGLLETRYTIALPLHGAGRCVWSFCRVCHCRPGVYMVC